MKKWSEYLVTEQPHHFGGKQRVYKFPNGFGASVIPEFEITQDEQYEEHLDPEDTSKMKPIKGVYEIAVLYLDELCYDTNITNDVLRRQCDPDVDNILGRISRL